MKKPELRLKKRLLWLALIVPLIGLNAFNTVYVISKIRGKPDFIWNPVKTSWAYFRGFHLIPLLAVIVFLFAFFLLKKRPWASLRFHLFAVIFLFLIALNFSLFPELNANSEGGRNYNFQWKRTRAFEELLEQSRARQAFVVGEYHRMNKVLQGKILIWPEKWDLIDGDLFNVYVKPGRIIKKDYPFELTKQDFERIRKQPWLIFRPFAREKWKKKNAYEFLVFDPKFSSEDFAVYTFGHKVLLLPPRYLGINHQDGHD